MSRDLERISQHWRELGAADPLWAVYVAPGTQHGRWDVGNFFGTGRAEVSRVLGELGALSRPARHAVALDFGCGVGRLSQALAEHFDRVIGVDVSAPMLQQARELDVQLSGLVSSGRLDFVLNERADLAAIESDSVDLVYSSLVLQHLSRELAAGYLAEFLRVLRPDGVAVVQVASRPTTSVKGWAFRLLPAAVTGFVQRRVLRYPAPMRMQAMPTTWVQSTVEAAGGQIAASAEDASYGGHWIYTRFVFERSPGRA